MTSQICSAAAVAAGFTLPYAGFPCTATVAQSLRPFPEYSVSLAPQFANQGDSMYDSLQVRFVKRLSHGIDVTSNYTFSKTENIGGYINADPSNRAIQKGLDSNDFPQILVTAITYRTPKATSNKFIRAATGNWTWSSALRYASGSLICGAAIGGQQIQHLYIRVRNAHDPRSRRAALPDQYRLPLHRPQQHQSAGAQPGRVAWMLLPARSVPVPVTTTIIGDLIRSAKT